MTPEEWAEEALCRADKHGEIDTHIADVIRAAVAEEREACAEAAYYAMAEKGTEDPWEALRWAAADIRARGVDTAAAGR